MYWNSITFERFIVLISFIFPSYVYMKEFDESMESTHFISVHKTIRRRIFFTPILKTQVQLHLRKKKKNKHVAVVSTQSCCLLLIPMCIIRNRISFIPCVMFDMIVYLLLMIRCYPMVAVTVIISHRWCCVVQCAVCVEHMADVRS